jgi:putative flippase GtrA
MYIKNNKKKVLNFILIGGICAILNIVGLYILTTILHLNYLISFILVFLVGNLLGFYLNKYYTFKTKTRYFWVELWKYYGVMLSSFGINLIFVYVMVEFFKIWYLNAAIIITIGCTIYNYFMHNKWSFQVKK